MVGELGDMNRALGKLGLSESPGPGRGLRLLCRLPPGDYRCCFLTAQIEVLRLAAGDHPPLGLPLSPCLWGHRGHGEGISWYSAGLWCPPPHTPSSSQPFPLGSEAPKKLASILPQTNLQAGPL